jgi:hypothetical protein
MCGRLEEAEGRAAENLSSALHFKDVLEVRTTEVRERTDGARKLEADLAERTAWALRLASELGELKPELEKRTRELEQRTAWALQLTRVMEEVTALTEKLRAELTKRTEWAQTLERDLEERTAWALKLQQELMDRTDRCRYLEARTLRERMRKTYRAYRRWLERIRGLHGAPRDEFKPRAGR